MACSLDRRLMPQVISGSDGHDPEVPPVPRQRLGRRDRFMAVCDRILAPRDVFLIPVMPMCA
jgi:hypothetical protein